MAGEMGGARGGKWERNGDELNLDVEIGGCGLEAGRGDGPQINYESRVPRGLDNYGIIIPSIDGLIV